MTAASLDWPRFFVTKLFFVKFYLTICPGTQRLVTRLTN